MDPLQKGDPEEVGGYRLLGRLGVGGMGQVFLGASPGGRKVAVKVIRPEFADDVEFRRRFAREIEAARQVGGFHTALVVDAGADADPPWMVTAYIPGPSLSAAIAKDGPLSIAAVRELGAALAEGLTAIHACGLVHRDLKPGNVILAEDGPRIIDFGIARAANASALTTLNAVIGTYGYMSPEQLGRREVTTRSDVFALGGLLVFAATGHGPFDADDLPAVIGRILSEPPDLSPLTGSLRDAVEACLDKEPDRRPPLDALLAYFSAADPGPWHLRPGSAPAEGLPALSEDATRPSDDRHDRAATMAGWPMADTVTHGGSLALAGPPLDARAGRIRLVTFSPDGRLLATAAEDGKVRLWDTGSWRQATPALAPGLPSGRPGAQFEQVAFTPDGRVVLAAAPDVPAVLAWDVRTGRALTPVEQYAWISPDGLFIAAEGKGAPALWEWDADKRRHVEFPVEKASSKHIGFLTVFSPNPGLLAATDDESSLHLWDTDLGKHWGFLRRPHRSHAVTGAAISADCCLVAVQAEARDRYGETSQLLQLWDITDSRLPQGHLLDEAAGIDAADWDIEFSADSRMLASTLGGRLRLWDTAPRGHGDLGEADDDEILLFSPDNRLLLDAGRRQLRLWDTATHEVASVGPVIKAARDEIECVAFSPDGRLIATGEGTSARVWLTAG